MNIEGLVIRNQEKRAAIIIFVLLCGLYITISINHLGVVPLVSEDEPWISAASYKLAMEGVYGSDMFNGYYKMEQHTFQMPVYSFLLAGVFKLFGVGVLPMRLLPVICGLGVLILVFGIGRQIGGYTVGLIAATLLIFLRLASGEFQTGVPLLAIARINRPDIAVPLLGLLAFGLFNKAEIQEKRGLYWGIGIVIGLCGLTHLYGLFWLPAIFVILFLRNGFDVFKRGQLYLIISGVVLAWLPWIIYVLWHWSDYLGQMQFVAERFAVFDIRFYLGNFLREIDRYRHIDMFDPGGNLQLLRPGMWIAILGTPGALWLIFKRHFNSKSYQQPIVATAIILLIQLFLFAVLIKVKFYNYMIATWPLVILLLAWFGVQLWNFKNNVVRGLLIVLLASVIVEGGMRMANRYNIALQTTPFEQFSQALVAHIPPGSTVLGLHRYWLGLHQSDYRSWLLPILLADSEYHPNALSFESALNYIRPEIILMDQPMQDYFEALSDAHHPKHQWFLEYQQFLQKHDAALIATLEDQNYGAIKVYKLD